MTPFTYVIPFSLVVNTMKTVSCLTEVAYKVSDLWNVLSLVSREADSWCEDVTPGLVIWLSSLPWMTNIVSHAQFIVDSLISILIKQYQWLWC